MTRDRLQALVPADMLLSDSARVRGFRLEGYGMFFDVEVPTLLYQGTLPGSSARSTRTISGSTARWSAASLVQKAGDANLEQALKRIELQVAPVAVAASSSDRRRQIAPPTQPGARVRPARRPRPRRRRAAAAADPILDDPKRRIARRCETR